MGGIAVRRPEYAAKRSALRRVHADDGQQSFAPPQCMMRQAVTHARLAAREWRGVHAGVEAGASMRVTL